MNNDAQRYHRHRFPSEIIRHAVWLYHRFGLSFCDVEDLLAEVSHQLSHQSGQRPLSVSASAMKPSNHGPPNF